MIITCEQCATQFQLDDARVPAGGARVRCSRCKHAFFVEPPGRSPESDPVHRAAQQALDEVEPPPPGVTQDLSRGSAQDGSGEGSDFDDESDFAGENPGGESDWEFNAAPGRGEAAKSGPADGRDAAREAIDDLLGARQPSAAAARPRASAPAPAARDDDEHELGSPESWDLLGDTPTQAVAAGASAPAEAPRQSREPASPARAALAVPDAEWVEAAEPSRVLAWIARGGHVIGWSVTALLLALGAAASLAPGLRADPGSRGSQPLAQLEAHAIEGRWVENTIGGALFVVSGELRNPAASASALGVPAGVRLLDASGAPFGGEPAALGPVIPERELREAAPEALRARQAEWRGSLAGASIPPGGALPFEAVIVTIPELATRFRLEPLAPNATLAHP